MKQIMMHLKGWTRRPAALRKKHVAACAICKGGAK